jgi:hypothetical protein
VDRALSQAGVGQQENTRQGIREAIDEMKAEIQAARAEGRNITIQPQFNPENVIPPQAVDISVAFFVMVAFVIVGLRWRARLPVAWIDGANASASDIAPRLDRIEQAVEAIAIEVERVSEGQRYTTKAISDLRGLPAANPIGGWPSSAREPERVPASESTRRP